MDLGERKKAWCSREGEGKSMVTMTVGLAWLAEDKTVEGNPEGGTKPKDRDSDKQ